MTCHDLVPVPGLALPAVEPGSHTSQPGLALAQDTLDPYPYCPPIADGVARPWTHGNSLCLPPDPVSVAQGRRHITSVLTRWGLERALDDTLIVAGELLSNAIAATHRTGIRTPIGLRLLVAPSLLALEAWDCVPDPPRLCPPGPPLLDGSDTTEAHGNGLLLVAELSWDWGYLARPDGGKVVWALLKL